MRSIFTFVFFAFLILVACKKEKELFVPAAQIYPAKIQSGVGSVTIQAGFSGLEITERGICYDQHNAPGVNGPHVAAGSGDGNIVQVINGLEGNTTYFARAYAKNRAGIGYSDDVMFTVEQGPQLLTGYAYARGTNSVAISATIGAFPASATGTYGICYATHKDPTISDAVAGQMAYPGNKFNLQIPGLQPGTVYYARSFANLPGNVFYGNEVMFNTYSGTVTDVDGNTYFTVRIGNQEWMASNLRTTRYRDAVSIPPVSSGFWLNHTGDARAIAGDYEPYANTLGRYYNREAATSAHGLAPQGWKVPSRQDWETLFAFVDIDDVAFKLISTEWQNAQAGNEWGFNILPGGMRTHYGGDIDVNATANFWSTSFEGGYYQAVTFGQSFYDYSSYSTTQRPGLSVRCLKE